MINISFEVNGQSLSVKQSKVVSDTIDYLEAKVRFVTAWPDARTWMHFEKGEEAYDVLLEDGKISKSKHLNLSAGTWKVYMHCSVYSGAEVVERITTSSVELTVEKYGGSVSHEEALPEVPKAAFEQIEADALDAKQMAKKANQTAEDAYKYAKSIQIADFEEFKHHIEEANI